MNVKWQDRWKIGVVCSQDFPMDDLVIFDCLSQINRKEYLVVLISGTGAQSYLMQTCDRLSLHMLVLVPENRPGMPHEGLWQSVRELVDTSDEILVFGDPEANGVVGMTLFCAKQVGKSDVLQNVPSDAYIR